MLQTFNIPVNKKSSLSAAHPFIPLKLHTCNILENSFNLASWSSPRPISNSQLHTLLYFLTLLLGQALDLLVTVSSIHYCTSTSALSTSSSSSPRPISNSQLHTLLYFHLCPIYLVVFKGSYFLRMGYLILRRASRLDAFSVYPVRTWLLGRRLGSLTDTPAVRPSRSSRTKDSSSQISYAHAG